MPFQAVKINPSPTRIRIGQNEKLFREQDLERVIKDLRVHAAPDMTGLRPSHIKCLFRGRREQDSPEVRSRLSLSRLIHLILEDPSRLGTEDFWENFCGGKLSVVSMDTKPKDPSAKRTSYTR
jgi:hypothetical protein